MLQSESITLEGEDPLCPFCGETARCEIAEVWSSREFLLDTCCEAVHDDAVAFLNDDPAGAAAWIGGLLEQVLPGMSRVRRLAEDGCGLLLDFQLEVEPVCLREVCAFVNEHHRHCKAPRGWRFGAAIFNGRGPLRQRIGVVSVGRPVARMLDQQRIVEVNRLCIDPTLPRPLVWNAASMLYGWAAKEARRRGFERIITYTLQQESGVSLKAAGWEPDHLTGGGDWDTASRPRQDSGPVGRKVRWTRQLVKRPVSILKGNTVALRRWMDRLAANEDWASEVEAA